jgi:hypothetical protein
VFTLKPLKDFNTASALSECEGTERQAFFGGIRAGNLALVLDVLEKHPDAIGWQEYRDDLHVADKSGLHVAAVEGRPEIARALVGAGAAVDAPDSGGRSPLFHALDFFVLATKAQGRKDVLRFLVLEAGANPEHKDAAGATPCMVAVERNYHGAVELIEECAKERRQKLAAEAAQALEAKEEALNREAGCMKSGTDKTITLSKPLKFRQGT